MDPLPFGHEVSRFAAYLELCSWRIDFYCKLAPLTILRRVRRTKAQNIEIFQFVAQLGRSLRKGILNDPVHKLTTRELGHLVQVVPDRAPGTIRKCRWCRRRRRVEKVDRKRRDL